MSEYFYSASTNSFYSISLQELYEDAGTLPSDVVAIDDSVYLEFAANDAPVGKYRVAGSNYLPQWADIPPPTHEELVAEAESKKAALMTEAEDVIKPLERVVRLDMATDAEEALLEAWEKYSILVMRIDPTLAPDIDWPEKPASLSTMH